jgi:hypothetical protein
MPQSTLDVIVGGLIAAIGGFLAILFVRWRDGIDAQSRFKAAVLITLDELGANEVNIEHLIGKAFGPAEFQDETYRTMELTLATRLRPADRQLLAEAYAPTRSRWAAEQQGGSVIDRTAMQKLDWIIPNQESLPAALAKIKSARIALAKYVPADQVRPATEATQSSN